MIYSSGFNLDDYDKALNVGTFSKWALLPTQWIEEEFQL
jgi:hypothetical protein